MLDPSIITITAFLLLPLSGLLLLPVLIERMTALEIDTSNTTSRTQLRRS
ncbi:MAG: hypothetical protein HKN83_03905 [Gammaproteobacteria bacterium]|nr:hypothetical protein [Gammaproteobacteria bacterium]